MATVMSRRDLVTDVEGKIRVNPEKLAKVVNDANSLINLKNSLGWKILMEDFIQPRMQLGRVLSAPMDKFQTVVVTEKEVRVPQVSETLPEARAAVKELSEFLSFVERKINDGLEANKKL